MAKQRSSPISAVDLHEYLLSQDDFALELGIYAMARSLGFSATHGGTYEDPVTKKPRQYDVRASFERDQQRLDLAIECKSLRASFPLLVSAIPRAPEECYHQAIWSFRPNSSSFHSLVGRSTWKTVALGRGPQFLYPPGAPVGKSTTQVGRSDKGEFVSGDSDVYDKWTQALGSIDDFVYDAADYYEDSPTGSFVAAVLPVLVVADGTLWVANYSEAGELIGMPEQADETTLFVGREYGRPMGPAFTASHLHICTRTGAEQFLSRIASDQAFWSLVFPQTEILEAAAR